ncbi:unnamed protein product, partial [Brassica rapa subsp. trilocularis]
IYILYAPVWFQQLYRPSLFETQHKPLPFSLSSTMSEKRIRMVEKNNNKRQRVKLVPEFSINDHQDVLVEILRRLDGPSLCSAACVCRLWSAVARNDSIWEELCFRQVSPRPSLPLRSVVSALGGYRRLYFLCIRPVLSRLPKIIWSHDQLQLSLSLYCVHYYERLYVGAWHEDAPPSAPPSSLMFLRKPVNVV